MGEKVPIAHVKKNADGTWAEPQRLEEDHKETVILSARLKNIYAMKCNRNIVTHSGKL